MTDANALTEPADIYRIIKSLQQARSFLSVKLGNSSDTFGSIILHTDFDKQVFVIDQLSPETGNPLIQRKTKIAVSGLLDGVPALFGTTTYHTALQIDGSRVHSLHFPETITYNQRRQAFRISVPRSIDSSITLQAPSRGASLQGRVIDISASGIGCEFVYHLQDLEKGSVISHVHIVVGNVLDMTCDLICQYPPHTDENSNYFRMGTEFCALNSSQEKAVARTVLMLQQNARKLETKR